MEGAKVVRYIYKPFFSTIPPPPFTALTSQPHPSPPNSDYVPQHFYHEFESSISHIVLGEISFILERMRFKVEELNYSIIKFTIWNFPKVKLSCPYIKYIWDNIASHLYNLVSSNFQPHVTLFHICLWFRAFLSNYAKNLYSVHSVLFSFIQSTLVLVSPIWSYSIHFSLI